MATEFPSKVRDFLLPLLAAGIPVWLVGSRASEYNRPDSDWDFIIFGDRPLLDRLRTQQDPGDIDALVVFDGDNFECPWPRQSDGATKSGSLSKWQWQQESPDRCVYRATNLRDPWGEDRVGVAIGVRQADLIA